VATPTPVPTPVATPTPVPLVISGFQALEKSFDYVLLEWRTNLPASTQIVYTNVANGQSGMTTLNSTPKTQHVVNVTGLERNTVYRFQAVSVSADGQVVRSLEVMQATDPF
jgi:hypothetical protein